MIKMYTVFDDDKPADCNHFHVSKTWNKSSYESFDDALRYARAWLGPYGGSYDGKDGIMLYPDEPYDYSGYGDMIEIRIVLCN